MTRDFVHWSLWSLVVDASVDPPVLHFDPERNDDDDVKIPESVSSMFPNVHPIPHFQVPSYPSERTCKESRNEIGRPSEDSHVSSVINCVCVNKTWPDVSNLPSSPVVICGGPPTLSITGTSVTCLTETEKHKQSQIIHNFTLSIK